MLLTRRAETSADESFVRELIVRTVGEQLGADAWPEPLRSQLLDLQHRAKRQSIRLEYGEGSSEIVVVDGKKAGWLVVVELPDHIRLVEIMMACEFRSQGVGSQVIRQVLAAGEAAKRPVRLQVNAMNTRAASLYGRLGFQRIGGDQVHHLMEWCAAQ